MPVRELRLRARIDTLTDERDHARAETARLQRVLASKLGDRNLRNALILYLREQGWSYPKIGKRLGIDHTTAIYVCDPQNRERRRIRARERYRTRTREG